MKAIQLVLLVSLIGAGGAGFAHGDESHAKKAQDAAIKEQTEWGIGGDAKAVNRKIEIGMSDAMRFSPEKIEVKLGETIRIVNRNRGKVMHEMVIGTREELERHAAMMVKFPNMEHDEPYMAHVGPGKSAAMVWTFNRPGEFEFACLIPGHFQAGMKGKIVVSPR